MSKIGGSPISFTTRDNLNADEISKLRIALREIRTLVGDQKVPIEIGQFSAKLDKQAYEVSRKILAICDGALR